MTDSARDQRLLAGRRSFLRMCGVAVGALGVTSTGCAQHIALRDPMLENYPFEPVAPDERGLRDLQLYTSQRIMLRRRLRHGEKSVRGGRIVSRKNKLVEETVVWSNTPGVVVDAGEDWLDVSFAPESSLRFVRGDGDVYRIAHTVDDKGKRFVEFQQRKWRPTDRTVAAVLLVRRRAHGSVQWRRTRLRGMRVGEA